MSAFIVFWGLASELAAAFQCSTPNVWKVEGNTCFDIVRNLTLIISRLELTILLKITFWECFAILNIFTDLVIIIWPAIVIGKVRTDWHRRIIIIVCFACRFLYVEIR